MLDALFYFSIATCPGFFSDSCFPERVEVPYVEPEQVGPCTEHRRGVLMTCEEAKLFDVEAFRKYEAKKLLDDAAKQHEREYFERYPK